MDLELHGSAAVVAVAAAAVVVVVVVVARGRGCGGGCGGCCWVRMLMMIFGALVFSISSLKLYSVAPFIILTWDG